MPSDCRPQFFILYDDVDFALRARRAGFRICAVRDAVLVRQLDFDQQHGLSGWKAYYMYRNLFTVHRRYGENRLVRAKPWLIAAGVVALSPLRGGRAEVRNVRRALRDSRRRAVSIPRTRSPVAPPLRGPGMWRRAGGTSRSSTGRSTRPRWRGSCRRARAGHATTAARMSAWCGSRWSAPARSRPRHPVLRRLPGDNVRLYSVDESGVAAWSSSASTPTAARRSHRCGR